MTVQACRRACRPGIRRLSPRACLNSTPTAARRPRSWRVCGEAAQPALRTETQDLEHRGWGPYGPAGRSMERGMASNPEHLGTPHCQEGGPPRTVPSGAFPAPFEACRESQWAPGAEQRGGQPLTSPFRRPAGATPADPRVPAVPLARGPARRDAGNL